MCITVGEIRSEIHILLAFVEIALRESNSHWQIRIPMELRGLVPIGWKSISTLMNYMAFRYRRWSSKSTCQEAEGCNKGDKHVGNCELGISKAHNMGSVVTL